MDLIEKIRKYLSQGGLKAPLFDLRYDDQYNVIGHVADEYFEGKDDKESQEFIWNTLKRHLSKEDLIKILTIFHESPRERVERLSESKGTPGSHSNYWSHTTPDLTKYWLFIAVAKFDLNYKSFYLIINEKENFKKGLTFEYNQEVIEFMELDQSEVYDELYNNTFSNAEAEIKFHIIKKHEALTEKGLWGKANTFNYVFDKFELKPLRKSQLIFNEQEIEMISKTIHQLENFGIKNEIELAIQMSRTIEKLKHPI